LVLELEQVAGGQCWGGVLIGDGGDEGEAGCSSCGQDGEQRQQLRDVRRASSLVSSLAA